MKRREDGFTLPEVLMAATLGGITLACIIQFFLAQLNQYRLISGNNKLNENLRTFSKFFEKDAHNSLEFYVFDNFGKATEFTKGSSVTLPKAGNCVLFVTERGMVNGGIGTIYFVVTEDEEGEPKHILYRALVSFNGDNQIAQDLGSLSKLPLGYLKVTENNDFAKGFTDGSGKKGIFYTTDHKRFGHSTDETYPHIAGCRHGIYVSTTLAEPCLKGSASETSVNFCFFSRNPRF